jgi:hypothetical protein
VVRQALQRSTLQPLLQGVADETLAAQRRRRVARQALQLPAQQSLLQSLHMAEQLSADLSVQHSSAQRSAQLPALQSSQRRAEVVHAL